MISLAVGIGWGLWAVWWPAELGKEANTSVWGFASHACLARFSSCSPGSSSDWLDPTGSRAAELATIVLWGLVVAVFLAARVPARPYAALILPPLLTVCCVGLRRNARMEQRPDVLDGILGRIRPLNVMILVADPAHRHRRLRRCSAASICTCRPTWCST